METSTWPKYHKGATFTVELGSLVENGFDLGLTDYPIFQESYRDELNAKIIEHYYFREIGQETPGLFKRFLNRRMNEVMPYYNQLYLSALADVDYLHNDIQERTGSRMIDTDQQRNATSSSDYANSRDERGASESSSNTAGTSRSVNSTTPQMQLSGREDYASALVDTGSDTTVTGTASNTGTSSDQGQQSNTSADTASTDTRETWSETVKALAGMTGGQALQTWRETMLNIDMMVIAELEDLFMGLWTAYANEL